MNETEKKLTELKEEIEGLTVVELFRTLLDLIAAGNLNDVKTQLNTLIENTIPTAIPDTTITRRTDRNSTEIRFKLNEKQDRVVFLDRNDDGELIGIRERVEDRVVEPPPPHEG